jgi:CRISPR-associated protein Cmr3
MRGLPWPFPSVVAGSFRTAVVKASSGDFSGDIPQRLLQIGVAGVFPVHGSELYLPAPNDAIAEPTEDGRGIKNLFRVSPQTIPGKCDLPVDGLLPVILSQSQADHDFKPAAIPAWWPVSRYVEWLLGQDPSIDSSFLGNPLQETRDHVCLDAETGAAAEGLIFASTGLNVAHMPRFQTNVNQLNETRFKDRYAEVTLSVRVTIPPEEKKVKLDQPFQLWHPLGGERRLVHWQKDESETMGWECPATIKSALSSTNRIRMILANPAIFKDGWKPGWLTHGLEGELAGVKLKLVGAINGRWKAVSGWSLQPHKETGRPGPKPIRRMVPAGSVYFFEVINGDASQLAEKMWLQSVSDETQEQLDGFGLAVWGTWNN